MSLGWISFKINFIIKLLCDHVGYVIYGQKYFQDGKGASLQVDWRGKYIHQYIWLGLNDFQSPRKKLHKYKSYYARYYAHFQIPNYRLNTYDVTFKKTYLQISNDSTRITNFM